MAEKPERHVRIAAATADPRRSYAEGVHTPTRRDSGCGGGLDALAAERHAHLDAGVEDPPHSYVERVSTPTRRRDSHPAGHAGGSLPDSAAAAADASLDALAAERHAHLDTGAVEPRRSYMERVHTPTRKRDRSAPTAGHPVTGTPAGGPAPVAPDATDALAAERHAHIDFDAAEPHGVVQRPLTPVRPRAGSREAAVAAESAAEAAAVAVAGADEDSTR